METTRYTSALRSLKTSCMPVSAAMASMSRRMQLEQRAASLGALVLQDQLEAVVGEGIDDHHARTRVLGEVADRLREELVRERDVLVVDHVHA